MSVAYFFGIALVVTVLGIGIGYKTKSLPIVTIAFVFLWAVVIGTLTNEIKPKGYEEIAQMKGKYEDTDRLIEEAGKEISLYELLRIKRSFDAHIKNDEP